MTSSVTHDADEIERVNERERLTALVHRTVRDIAEDEERASGLRCTPASIGIITQMIVGATGAYQWCKRGPLALYACLYGVCVCLTRPAQRTSQAICKRLPSTPIGAQFRPKSEFAFAFIFESVRLALLGMCARRNFLARVALTATVFLIWRRRFGALCARAPNSVLLCARKSEKIVRRTFSLLSFFFFFFFCFTCLCGVALTDWLLVDDSTEL